MQKQMQEHKMQIKQRETRRKLEHAKLECDILSESDSLSVHSLPVFSSNKDSKVHAAGKSSESLSSLVDKVSIGHFSASVIYSSTSQNKQTSPALQTSTVSTGRYGANQRPGQVDRSFVPEPPPQCLISSSSDSAPLTFGTSSSFPLNQSTLPGNPFPHWLPQTSDKQVVTNFDSLNNFGNSSSPIHVVSDSLASTSRLTNYLPASLSLDTLVNKPRQASVSYIQSRPSTSFVPASISSQFTQTQAFSQPAYTSTHVRQPVDNQFISAPPLGQTSTYDLDFQISVMTTCFYHAPNFQNTLAIRLSLKRL